MLTLAIAMGVSVVFLGVTIFALVLRVRAEAIASTNEEHNLFRFVRASGELFDEYYRANAQDNPEGSVSRSPRIASET